MPTSGGSASTIPGTPEPYKHKRSIPYKGAAKPQPEPKPKKKTTTVKAKRKSTPKRRLI